MEIRDVKGIVLLNVVPSADDEPGGGLSGLPAREEFLKVASRAIPGIHIKDVLISQNEDRSYSIAVIL